MVFENIKRSISVHSDKEPTIYSVLCMVESLFRDVEEQTDNELAYCEPGDGDKMAVKLLWLCDQILEVRRAHADTSRWEGELKKATAHITSAKEDIAVLSRFADQLSKKQEELSLLRKEQESLLARQSEYQRLEEEKAVLEQRIAQLQAVDIDTTVQKIAYLQQERTRLSDLIEGSNKELAQTQAACVSLSEEHNVLSAQLRALEQKYASIQEEKSNLLRNRERLTAAVENLTLEKEHLNLEITDLLREQLAQAEESTALEEQKNSLRSQTDLFRTETRPLLNAQLLSLKEELSQEEQYIQGLEQTLNALQAQKLSLCSSRDDLLRQKDTLTALCGEVGDQVEALSESHQALTEEFEGLKQKQVQLELEEADLLARKQALQQHSDTFKNENLAPLEQEISLLQMEISQEESFLRDSRQRLCALQEKKAQIIDETSITDSKISEINAVLPDLEKRLGNITVLYDNARKQQAELSEKYGELNAQWTALYSENAKTERDDLPKCQASIEAEQQKYKALRSLYRNKEEELAALQTQVASMEENLVHITGEYEILTERFNKADSTSRQLRKDIEELELQTDSAKVESYRRQLEEKRTELQQLRTEEVALNTQIETASRQCSSLTNDLELLKGRKAELDKAASERQMLCREMERYSTKEFADELHNAKSRLKMLEKAYTALKRDMAFMGESLNRSPFAVPVNSDLPTLLLNLNKAVNAMSGSLANCADSLKLEVKS